MRGQGEREVKEEGERESKLRVNYQWTELSWVFWSLLIEQIQNILSSTYSILPMNTILSQFWGGVLSMSSTTDWHWLLSDQWKRLNMVISSEPTQTSLHEWTEQRKDNNPHNTGHLINQRGVLYEEERLETQPLWALVSSYPLCLLLSDEPSQSIPTPPAHTALSTHTHTPHCFS